jgi:hypothetical protein
MINVKDFVENILLDSVESTVENAIIHERNMLRRIYGAIEIKNITALTSSVLLDPDTANVLMVSFNHVILHRATEDVLDALDSSWKAATDLVPRHYVYRGEEPLQQLRLHPIPTVDGILEVIKFREPNITDGNSVARWHDVYVALAAIGRISTIDTLRARPQLEKITSKLNELLSMPFRSPEYRRSRS